MTPHELFNQKKEWQDKVSLVSYYHNRMILKTHGDWTIKDTAKYFEISVGLVSENLKLAKHLETLKVFKTRKIALNVMRIREKFNS